MLLIAMQPRQARAPTKAPGPTEPSMSKNPRTCTSCGRTADPPIALTVETPDGDTRTATICARCRPWAERLIGDLGLEINSQAGSPPAAEDTHTPFGPPLDIAETPGAGPAAPATPVIGRGERSAITHGMTALERDLAVIDTEWNSSNTDEAEVIALGVARLRPDGTGYRTAYTVKPRKPVEPETTAIHGLTNEMLADLPPFDTYAQQIVEDLSDADIGGYAVGNDLMLIERALENAGAPWPTGNARVVDALRIWQTAEPRTLTDAHDRFVGPTDGAMTAHDAGDDAMMTARVIEALAARSSAADIEQTTDAGRVDLTGRFRRDDRGEIVFDFGRYRHRPARLEPDQLQWMLKRGFAPSAKAVAQRLLEEHHPERRTVDPAGRFTKDEAGNIVFNFGKHKGREARLEPGFLDWMLRKDFPDATKTIAREILEGHAAERDP